MKKIYALLALILVFASCSEWKYNKGIKWKQPEYQASNIKANPAKAEKTLASTAQDEPTAETSEAATPEAQPEEKEITEENTATESISREQEEITILSKDDDSLETVDPEVVRMAFDAEDQGRKSRNLGIAGIVMTLTYIFAFVGLVLAVIGLIKGVNSLRARYNTPKGVSMARTGIITSSIIIGLYVLAIVVVITALFLLL